MLVQKHPTNAGALHPPPDSEHEAVPDAAVCPRPSQSVRHGKWFKRILWRNLKIFILAPVLICLYSIFQEQTLQLSSHRLFQ